MTVPAGGAADLADRLDGVRADAAPGPVLPTRGRRKRRSRWVIVLQRIVETVAVPLVVVALWWLVTDRELVGHGLLPGPTESVRALIDWIAGTDGSTPYSGKWLEAAVESSKRVVSGYLAGAVVGVAAGIPLGYSPVLRRMFEPFINVLRAVPIIGWLPLAFVVFGFGMTSTIVLIGMGAFFIVVVSTIAAVQGVSTSLVRVGAMAGASRWQQLRLVILPASLPDIVTSLRVAMGYAWVLVVVGEWTAVRTGLGHVLLDAYGFFRYPYVIAAMASVGFMGFVSDRLVVLLSRPFVRWHVEISIAAGGPR